MIVVSKLIEFTHSTSFTDICKAYEENCAKNLSLVHPSTLDPDAISTVSTLPESKFSLKAIQQISLNDFDGDSEKYMDWFKHIVCCFGSAASEPLLYDLDLCKEHLEISYAAKC